MSKQLAKMMLTAIFFLSAAWAQQSPFVGTWKLNPSKSKFGDSPRMSQTVVVSQEGDQLKHNSEITYQGGDKIHSEWSATLDGKPYPLQGDAHYDTVMVTKIDDSTLMVVSKKGPEVSRSSRWAISSNGKTMTRTMKIMDGKGREVNNVVVFDRQR